jgi:hypothetical protein
MNFLIPKRSNEVTKVGTTCNEAQTFQLSSQDSLGQFWVSCIVSYALRCFGVFQDLLGISDI